MHVMLMIAAGTAALGLVSPLGAQQPAPKKEPPPMMTQRPEAGGCVSSAGRTEWIFRRGPMDSVLQNRAVLGVQPSPTGTKRDTLGVFISRVTPKGPAENAGIVEGDRIASINGIDLRVNSGDVEDSYASELATRRLTREVAKLKPGNVARLRVYSGGRTRDVQVTLGRASDFRGAGPSGFMFEGMPGDPMRIIPGFDGMRMQLRNLPEMHPEDFERKRMELDGLRDRIRIERLEPPHDAHRFRVIAPSR